MTIFVGRLVVIPSTTFTSAKTALHILRRINTLVLPQPPITEMRMNRLIGNHDEDKLIVTEF